MFGCSAPLFVCRYGVKENTLGVGLNQLAVEGSHQAGFLAIYEEKFTADVRWFLTASLLCPIIPLDIPICSFTKRMFRFTLWYNFSAVP